MIGNFFGNGKKSYIIYQRVICMSSLWLYVSNKCVSWYGTNQSWFCGTKQLRIFMTVTGGLQIWNRFGSQSNIKSNFSGSCLVQHDASTQTTTVMPHIIPFKDSHNTFSVIQRWKIQDAWKNVYSRLLFFFQSKKDCLIFYIQIEYLLKINLCWHVINFIKYAIN